MKTFLLIASLIPTIAYSQFSFPSPSLNSTIARADQTVKLNRILVENRVLASVNSNPITVIDVMKKMDAEFYMEYPHLMDSDIARYQFYRGKWRFEFDRMVNGELILADAKARNIELTKGDVRQEIEKRFGPQVILNIDKIGLTYDEVWAMVERDIFVQRMTQGYLYLKGVFNVTPSDLLRAYQDFSSNNKKPDVWNYYMISFSGANALENAQMCKQVLAELAEKNKNFSTISLQFKDKMAGDDKKMTISKPLELSSNEISEPHLRALSKLELNHFSDPIQETSRVTQQPVYRLFYLANYKPSEKIELPEVEEQLLMKVKNEKFEQEYHNYIVMLRDRYGLTQEMLNDSMPADFEPFKLK